MVTVSLITAESVESLESAESFASSDSMPSAAPSEPMPSAGPEPMPSAETSEPSAKSSKPLPSAVLFGLGLECRVVDQGASECLVMDFHETMGSVSWIDLQCGPVDRTDGRCDQKLMCCDRDDPKPVVHTDGRCDRSDPKPATSDNTFGSFMLKALNLRGEKAALELREERNKLLIEEAWRRLIRTNEVTVCSRRPEAIGDISTAFRRAGCYDVAMGVIPDSMTITWRPEQTINPSEPFDPNLTIAAGCAPTFIQMFILRFQAWKDQIHKVMSLFEKQLEEGVIPESYKINLAPPTHDCIRAYVKMGGTYTVQSEGQGLRLVKNKN